MRMNHDTHIDTEIDEALTRAGITADNIPGTREAAREFARLVTTRTNHTPQDALRIAAEAIARTLHLAATAPARGGTIPQVTFLPPATADEQADLDAITEAIKYAPLHDAPIASAQDVETIRGYPNNTIRKVATS